MRRMRHLVSYVFFFLFFELTTGQQNSPLFQGNIIRSEYFLYQALRERNESQGHSDGDGTQGHPDDDGYLRRLHRGEEAGSDQEDGR